MQKRDDFVGWGKFTEVHFHWGGGGAELFWGQGWWVELAEVKREVEGSENSPVPPPSLPRGDSDFGELNWFALIN